ncbi:DUF4157 domain-containing protein [Humitalea sp. 24SJ18S-53]|uniref:eCIS core domain-containing protein n=1 Tax=Humitalea sp. 24SJ18S-53 TaxID=3422307 RepID=UPI003D676C86
MTPALLQRACGCGKKDDRKLQRSTRSGATASGFAPPIVHAVLRAPGTALDDRSRPLAERILGPAFSQVRIHSDSRAAESATAVDALAYTVGAHIVFGPGRFAPGTAEGDHLLAHELVHVAQQGAAPVPANLVIGAPDSPFEAQAERFATQAPTMAPVTLMRALRTCESRPWNKCKGFPCKENDKNGICNIFAGKEGGKVCKCSVFDPKAAEERVREILPAWIIAVISVAALALIIACFASGVCEAAALVVACGAATALVIIVILREAGVEVIEA